MLRRLPSKGTIGIFAPAYQPNQEKLARGISYLKAKGFTVVEGASLRASYGYFAGNDDLRLDDLHRLFADPQIDAIICARGGWGTLRLLDRIDYDLIQKNPKLFVGYSDITTLQLAFWTKAALPSLSGPMAAVEMGGGILPFTEQHFWDFIFNEEETYTIPLEPEEIAVWQTGQAEGPLLGGCLSLVSHQLGTPYSPDYNGAILFLEDVGEAPYKIDRYLAHLKQAGIFKQINGLILGNFIDCEEENGDASFTCEEVIRDYFAGADYPVIYNFPYGHGERKASMPVGAQAVLDTSNGWLKLKNIFA
ncbi:MAG TPA: LD-carboxypeptidase [Caldithrix abyssi]|uniref:LD-carboxypeptidase n=1 Tax=Caldithrix abyssi TaxID=187145 RepID=A0A7V4U4J3_CALAY|nr:LD-carboxypeptidase [Caldithrix abyssi]